MKPKGKKAEPEFSPKKSTKPGMLAKARKVDEKSDRAIAKRYGVKFKD